MLQLLVLLPLWGGPVASDGAREPAPEEPLRVLYFRADWCSRCREFDADTLPNREVRRALQGVQWIEVDIDREVVKAHEYGIRTTPTLVVEDVEGRVLRRGAGQIGATRLVEFLQGTGEFEPARVDPRTEIASSPRGYRGRPMCFAHVGYGPVDIETQAPGNAIRQALPPLVPSTLSKGGWEVQITETMTNIWNFENDSYRIDYGSFETKLSAAYGLTDDLLIEVELNDFSRWDSILDPVTNLFHDIFNLDDAGRDEFPERDNVIFFEGGSEPDIENRDEGSVARDVALTLQHNLTYGTSKLPAISYAVTGRLQAGGESELEGSDFSLGFSGSLARRVAAEWYLYGSFGYVFHGPDEWEELQLDDEQWSSLLAVEWRYHAWRSWTLQYLLTEGVSEEREPLDELVHEFYLGWKHEFEPGKVLELGVIENAFVHDNTPDFGLHGGIKMRW
jgi:hypothetical protein